MPSLLSARRRLLFGSALACLAAQSALCEASAQAADAQTTSPGGSADAGPVAPTAADDTVGSVGLGEIIVTAQRRSENLQRVPIAVSAFNAADLARSGVRSTDALPQLIPSVQFTRSGASGLFFVRGVGTTNAAVGEEGSNAFYVDNVYIADLSQLITSFNNIERIEVLKGPQGTLFGRNAFGGLVHVITREPGGEPMLRGEVGFGNYMTVAGKLYASTPLGDKAAIDIALTGSHQDAGWGRDLTLNRRVHIQDYGGARSKLVVKPADGIKLTLAGDIYRNTDNLAIAWKIAPGVIGTGGVRGPAGYDTTADYYPITRQRIWGTSLTGEFDLGFATLSSISAYRHTSNHTDFDADGARLPVLHLTFTSTSKAFQQELRLASNGSGPLAWQIGGFYLHSVATNNSDFFGLSFPGIRALRNIADLRTNSLAGFGEVTYAITSSTKLTGGVRYTSDRRRFTGMSGPVALNGAAGPFTFNPFTRLSYGEFTYRAALRQEFTRDISAYVSVNRGFKAGTYSLQAPLNAPAKPQFITAYEVGLKSELFDRKLRVNLAAYHYDIDDYQVRSAATGAPGTTVLLNAATVKVDGFDVEFEAAPTERLRLYGGFTWLDSHYGRFGGPGAVLQAPIVYPRFPGQTQPTTCPAALSGTRDPGVTFPGTPSGGFFTCLGDVSGLHTPLAPKFAGSLGASYTIPVAHTAGLTLNGLYSYNSGYVFEPDNIFRQGAFSLVNLSAELRLREQLGVELYARNLFDKQYAVQDLTSGTGTTQALAPPRTYGINFKVDF